MDSYRANNLKAKIKARNLVNLHAKRISTALLAFFAQFVGTKVIKRDGTLIKAIKDQLPNLNASTLFRQLHSTSEYSLCWDVTTCVNVEGNSGCVYEDITLYIGKLQGDQLAEVYTTPYDGRTDYTFEEVKELREKAAEAQKKADDARAACSPFGVS